MPRRKRSPIPNYETFDEDFDEDASSSSSRSNQNPPIQRNAANARERARMRILSSAFCRLKTKLPNIPSDTKLSKLDTLRLATIYIQQLKALLDGETMDSDTSSSFHPAANSQSLTWPFTFQQINNNLRHNHHHHNHHHSSNQFYHHPTTTTTTTNNFLDGWSATSSTPSSSTSISPSSSKFQEKFYSNQIINSIYDNSNGHAIN